MPSPTIKTNISMYNTILSRLNAPYLAITCVISAADVTAVNGKKIVPAGTFIGSASAGKTIMADKVKAKPANDATTEGLVFNTIDVTNGDCEVAMLVDGTVGLDRIPEAPAAAAKTALKGINFTKD